MKFIGRKEELKKLNLLLKKETASLVVIKGRFSTLYIIEIKFSQHPVKDSIINEVQEKIVRMKTPRHMSCRPVLIHVNGVDDSVLESRYFSEIIDFGQFLN